MRGQVHDWHGRTVIPTFHPAAILHGGGERSRQFQLLERRLRPGPIDARRPGHARGACDPERDRRQRTPSPNPHCCCPRGDGVGAGLSRIVVPETDPADSSWSCSEMLLELRAPTAEDTREVGAALSASLRPATPSC